MKVLYLLPTLLLLTSCVPKTQYDALVTERNYYRNQTLTADSLGGAQLRTVRDSATVAVSTQRSELRQIEDLSATNRSLNDQLQDLRGRYEQLLAQQGVEATAETSQPQQPERDFSERQPIFPAQQVPATRPQEQQAKGTETDPMAPTASRDRLAEELRQILNAAAADSSYLLQASTTDPSLTLTLGGALLFEQRDTLSLAGEQLLRQLSTTLRAYPRTRLLIVGHAASSGGNPQLAYQQSTAQATSVSLLLSRFGLDPGRMIVGGTGFYGSTPSLLTGTDAARRIDLIISLER